MLILILNIKMCIGTVVKYTAVDGEGHFRGLAENERESIWAWKENGKKIDVDGVFNPEEEGYVISRVIVGM